MIRLSFFLLIFLPALYFATLNETVGNKTLYQIIYLPNGAYIIQPVSTPAPAPAIAPSVKNSTCDPNPPPPDRRQDRFTPSEIIHAAGFPNETHHIITSDGYILTAHRIRKDGGMPLLILHGIFSSSRDFLLQRGNNTLPYQLWLAGYDVWLGNMRGTSYSLGHIRIRDPVNSYSFWDFSWDQIAQKDVPAFIDYILRVTKRTELQCVGYSLGAMTIIAGVIRKPEYGRKCKCFTGLAPVTKNGNMTSIAFRAPAAFTLPEEPLRSVLYYASPSGRLLPHALSYAIQRYAPGLCKLGPQGLCTDLFYLLLGEPNPDQVDPEMQAKIFAGFPSTTSIRTFVQVAYGIFYPREFREYVYQTEDEVISKYGTTTSPVYNLGKFNVPTTLYVGPADEVATANDINDWGPRLGGKSDVVFVNNPAWGHLDFLFAMDACEKLYAPMIENLKTCARS